MGSRLQRRSVTNVNTYGRPELYNVVYDDSQVPGFSSRPGASAPAFASFRGSAIYTFQFAVGDDVSGSIQLPHGYVPATSLTAHVHYCLDNTAPGAAANVKWQLTYALSAGLGSAFPAPGAALTVERDFGGGVAYQEQYDNFTTITFAAGVESSMILLSLSRIAASSDEYSDVVHLLSWDVHLQKNSMGTHQANPPYTK